jgi:hypothetical protein
MEVTKEKEAITNNGRIRETLSIRRSLPERWCKPDAPGRGAPVV